jgi:selenocysteine lyase/cysteine desulfurase
MTHASNVTGSIEPVMEVGMLVREHGARFLVDAAQTLGHFPVDVGNLKADLLAAPGHKGLMGPLGTGVLYLRAGLEKELQTVRQGGTGTDSGQDRQPDSLPFKFEPGNHNVPGLVGLAAALRWIEQHTVPTIWEHEQKLATLLRQGFWKISGVRVYESDPALCSVGVVSISIEGYDPQEAAVALDANFGVQVRAGLHCAPLIHKEMGTFERGGTVRFSIGAFNTTQQIDAAIAAVGRIANAT